jgi:predicted RNA methylase
MARDTSQIARRTSFRNGCIMASRAASPTTDRQTATRCPNDRPRLVSLLRYLLDVLRDNEHLVGHSALRVMSNLVTLKMLEPRLRVLRLERVAYSSDVHDLHRFADVAYLGSCDQANLPYVMDLLWEQVLSRHEETRELFPPGASFGIRRHATYVAAVTRLNAFPFQLYPCDIHGEAYEEIIKDTLKGKIFGQFFTPPRLIQHIVDMAPLHVRADGTHPTVYDPAMGTGGFLIAADAQLRRLAAVRGVALRDDFCGIAGREVDDEAFALARANIFVRTSGSGAKTRSRGIELGDSIRSPTRGRFDIILTNPPFGISGMSYKNLPEEQRRALPVATNSAVSLFLQLVIHVLRVDGEAFVIVPNGRDLFSPARPLLAVRRLLLHACDLREVVAVPNGVFSSASIQTCVLHFVKKANPGDASDALRTTRVVFSAYDAATNRRETCLTMDGATIRDEGYNLTLKHYHDLRHRLPAPPPSPAYVIVPLRDLVHVGSKGNVAVRDVRNRGPYAFYNAGATNPVGHHGVACFGAADAGSGADEVSAQAYLLFVKSGGNCRHPVRANYGLGKVFLVEGRTCGTSEVVPMYPAVDRVVPEYLFHYLRSRHLDLQTLARYSTNLGHVDMHALRRYPVPLLPLAQQARWLKTFHRSRKQHERRRVAQAAALRRTDDAIAGCFDATLRQTAEDAAKSTPVAQNFA